MAGRRIKYVVARSRVKRITAVHIILDTEPNLTQCGLYILDWPWRAYPRTVPNILLCMNCTHERLDWDALRNEG